MTQHASLTIRKLDPRLKRQLRLRAAAHGRSMEEEAREILKASLAGGQPTGQELVDRIRRRFEAAGYVDIEWPKRSESRPLPDFK
ncbi:MAG: hypothetical protein JNK82_40905 [Myxococcaceae bacterium]|nr:hypothetical protein [Myxococcaceae bacterium]